MRLLLRTGTLLLAVVAGLLTVTVAPAEAANKCDGWGSSSPSSIGLCVLDWSEQRGYFFMGSQVFIGRSATTATGCKVTVHAALRRPGVPEWNTNKRTTDCLHSLQVRDNWSNYDHGLVGTAATQIDVRGCIDLTFRGSTSSGWQRCTNTGWHALQQ